MRLSSSLSNFCNIHSLRLDVHLEKTKKKTSVTPEPLSAIHFSHIFYLQLFLWPFSCPLTPVLNRLFAVFPRQYQISTLLPSPNPRSSPSWSLTCSAHVAHTICLLLRKNFRFCCPPPPPPHTHAHTLPIVEYTGRRRPKELTFWSLQHSERFEKSLS